MYAALGNLPTQNMIQTPIHYPPCRPAANNLPDIFGFMTGGNLHDTENPLIYYPPNFPINNSQKSFMSESSPLSVTEDHFNPPNVNETGLPCQTVPPQTVPPQTVPSQSTIMDETAESNSTGKDSDRNETAVEVLLSLMKM